MTERERTRFESFIAAKCAGNKNQKLEDIAKFPWENVREPDRTPMDDAKMDELCRRAKEIIEKGLIG